MTGMKLKIKQIVIISMVLVCAVLFSACMRSDAGIDPGDWGYDCCVTYDALGGIINSRIRRVVYGAADTKAGCCGSVTDLFALPYNHRPACEGGVLEEECSQLLRDFFRALRLAPPKPRWKPAVLPAQGGDHA